MAQHIFGVAIASSLIALTGVRTMTGDEYIASRQRIEGDYQRATARCVASGNAARDACLQEASIAQQVATAELEQQYAPSPANARKVAEAKGL